MDILKIQELLNQQEQINAEIKQLNQKSFEIKEELEKLAEEGNKEAVYQYLENKDSVKQSRKTKNMIRPFIEEKEAFLKTVKPFINRFV